MNPYGDLPATKDGEGLSKKPAAMDIFAVPAPVQKKVAGSMLPPPAALKKNSSGMAPPAALKKKPPVPSGFPMPAPINRPKPSAAGLPPPEPASPQQKSVGAGSSMPPPSGFPVPAPVQKKGGEFAMPAPKAPSSTSPGDDGQPSQMLPPMSAQPSKPKVVKNIHQIEEVEDPYDPARPNDYTAYCKERLAKQKEEERQRELKLYLEQQEKERSKLEAARKLAAEGLGPFNMGAAGRTVQAAAGGADGMAPPPAGRGRGRGVSNLPAWMSKQQGDKPAAAAGLPRPGGGEPGQFEDKAEFPAPAGMAPPAGGPARPKKKGLFTNPTKVVLLKNMVAPGEVDQDLAPETKEECAKYGPVSECVVHEETDPALPEEEKVRTFVAFERQDAAIKAFMDMNGRFFAGRQIAAVFYDEKKFDARDLVYSENEAN